MASKSNQAITTPLPGSAEEKWKQQVRLACVQAVCTRATAAHAVWDDFDVIRMATALSYFVINGVRSD